MYRRFVFILLALLTAALPFAAPAACARALREGLALCGGPLLLSLFPFLHVQSLFAVFHFLLSLPRGWLPHKRCIPMPYGIMGLL